MRAGAHTIKTEGAVEIAALFGLEELEFAPALTSVTADTIEGSAVSAYLLIPDTDFSR
jgi:hypothetical protein